MDQDGCEVGAFGDLGFGEPHHALAGHGAALDQPGIGKATGAFERAAHLGQIAPGLHDDQGIGAPHVAQQIVLGQRAHQHAENIVAPGDGNSGGVPAPGHAVDAGHDLDLGAAGQPRLKMHEGAVEQGIALAEHHDVAGCGESGKPCGPAVVKASQQLVVFDAAERQLGRNRVFHRVFRHICSQHSLDNAARLARSPCLAKIRDMARGADQPVRPDTDQIGVAGAEAGANDLAQETIPCGLRVR